MQLSISSILAGLLIWYGSINSIPNLANGEIRSAIGVVAQISGTMAGFLLTVLSILATIANSRLVRNMHKTGHYGLLLKRLFINTAVFVVAMTMGMIGVFIDPTPSILISTLGFFSVLGMLLLIDSGHKLWMVLRHVGPIE